MDQPEPDTSRNAPGPGNSVDAGGVLGRLKVRRARRREPTWQEIAQCLFFIVESIDDYLHTDEHCSNGSTRTVYSGPNRARLMGGDPPPDADVAVEWARMIHPDDRAAHEAHLTRLLAGRPSEAQYRLHGFDGVTRWMHARARPRRHDDRLLVDGIVSDVTRQVAAEAALAEAERDLRHQLKLNEHQAHHDHLTGLGNRRLLLADLERLAAVATRTHPLRVVLLDLDGFKHYNDTYGHPAGDALLARLGKNLAVAVGPAATCYRLGGDEFCVLHRGRDDFEPVMEAVLEALAERGEGFEIGCSFGAALIPEEAQEMTDALQLADQRLYAQKRAGPTRRDAVCDALLQLQFERAPDLRDHTSSVAGLAHATGERLGLNAEQLERLRRVALLHDIGKMAIPDSILEKPGPLTPDERAVIELHTVIGERIIAASPALEPVASLVRSHHERWDGTGYPDGLLAEQTPVEARIVAACDAFSAITSQRPYQAARTTAEAVAELRRCSGTHFDPAVVEAVVAALGEIERRAADNGRSSRGAAASDTVAIVRASNV